MKNVHSSLAQLETIWRELEAPSRKPLERLDRDNASIQRFVDTLKEIKDTLDHLPFLVRSTTTARRELAERPFDDFDERRFDLESKIAKFSERFRSLILAEPEPTEPLGSTTETSEEVPAA